MRRASRRNSRRLAIVTSARQTASEVSVVLVPLRSSRNHDGDTYRTVYTDAFLNMPCTAPPCISRWVPGVGIATPRQEIRLVIERTRRVHHAVTFSDAKRTAMTTDDPDHTQHRVTSSRILAYPMRRGTALAKAELTRQIGAIIHERAPHPAQAPPRCLALTSEGSRAAAWSTRRDSRQNDWPGS